MGISARIPLNPTHAAFLDVLLTGTIWNHPEYLQEAGNRRLSAMAQSLVELGWAVDMVMHQAPTAEQPNRKVALYYIGDHNRQTAFGDDLTA